VTRRRDTTELLAAILRAIDGHLRAGATERARHVMAALATLRDEVLALIEDVTTDCAAMAATAMRSEGQ